VLSTFAFNFNLRRYIKDNITITEVSIARVYNWWAQRKLQRI